MTQNHTNNYPKLHNSVWPGLVGKGDGGEPAIDLDTMIELTAAAEVKGARFDGFDIFLGQPHFDIDGGDEAARRLADKARARGLQIGTVVAPVYAGTGGGSPIEGRSGQKKFFGTGPQRPAAWPSFCGSGACGRWARCGSIPSAASSDGATTRRATSGGSPRRSARPARSPRTTASGWRPRAKSAGAACTVGSA